MTTWTEETKHRDFVGIAKLIKHINSNQYKVYNVLPACITILFEC